MEDTTTSEVEKVTKKRKKMKKKAATPKTNGHAKSNGASKFAIAVQQDVGVLVRKLRAQMELETGERVSLSDAVRAAVEEKLE